jgi:hypothetical protein
LNDEALTFNRAVALELAPISLSFSFSFSLIVGSAETELVNATGAGAAPLPLDERCLLGLKGGISCKVIFVFFFAGTVCVPAVDNLLEDAVMPPVAVAAVAAVVAVVDPGALADPEAEAAILDPDPEADTSALVLSVLRLGACAIAATFFGTVVEVIEGPMTLAIPDAASSRDLSLIAFCLLSSFARIETRSSGMGLFSCRFPSVNHYIVHRA